MVYESDFYTTRRPYRPSSTYSSVTVSVRLSLTLTTRTAPSPGAGHPRTSSTFVSSSEPFDESAFSTGGRLSIVPLTDPRSVRCLHE